MTERHVILIVDDTPENLQVLGDMLELEGHEVLIATNGLQALDIAMATPPPDLILLDIMMPGIDGYEVCRRLKADPVLRTIPVIFISALGMTEQKVQAFCEGGVDYITKPFQTEEVVARVHTHLSLTQVKRLECEIAERKKVEQELKKLAEAVRQTSEAIVVTLPDGWITFANPAFEQITGYRFDEVVGLTLRILKSDQQDEAFYQNLWDTLLSGNRWAGRLIEKRKDGIPYTAEYSISPVKDQKGHIANFVWIMRDITKELNLEKQMIQAQKMEAIGTLAGGIAHDFNNILFSIMGMSQLLMEDLPAGSPEYNKVVLIHKAGERAGNLVSQILSFSRQKEHKKMPVRIQIILKEALKLARATIPSNIEITQSIQKDCGLVMADLTNLHQIAMNLITNAFHAVENTGGIISIQLQQTILTGDDLADTTLAPGKYALLSVSDTGHGISPEVMEKIFEPYFTTKEQGKGTGLGLSVVFGIVKEHGGVIRVTSEVGKGSTFNIYLPLLENVEAAVFTEKAVVNKGGVERILLVDDEEPVVQVVKQMLERFGYQVKEQSDSMEALQTFKTDPNAFDLVISDMMMPKMTGDQLARELIAVKPGLPVILCTGYNEKFNKLSSEVSGVKGFLIKPIAQLELAALVRKVLDSR
ncbi:MAG: hybrid sensor histidine kinase/response regulator [Desulfobacterium sp.]|nr:hybrid sensor histidine kinase/response regulator [Desulfobacterium sp.]